MGILTLGVFFGLFQPSALHAYARSADERSQAMLSDIETKYNLYAADSQGLIPASTLVSNGQSCHTDQIYKGLAEHTVVVERIVRDTSPDTALAQVPLALGFSDPELRTLHTQNYETYRNAFGYLRDHQDTLQRSLEFLDFRNQWIDICTTIQASLRNAPVIEACLGGISASEAYLGSQNPVAATQVQNLVTKCRETQVAGFNYSAKWLFEYLEIHQQLMGVNVGELIQEQATDLTRNYEQVQTVFEGRRSVMRQTPQNRGRLGYLLRFDPRAFS